VAGFWKTGKQTKERGRSKQTEPARKLGSGREPSWLISVPLGWPFHEEEPIMKMIVLAVALAAAVSTAAWAGGSTASPAPSGLQVAQANVDVQVGRDRDRDRDRLRDEHRDRHDLTVGIGPGGVRLGHCRTVTTTVERYGRTITRRERQCD
jgi:hypothetical protein